MPFYTLKQLEKDADYIVTAFDQVQEAELDYIQTKEYQDQELLTLDILRDKDFNDLIQPLTDYFPKAYQYLAALNIQYQVFFKWYRSFCSEVKDGLICQAFFHINNRIYFLDISSYKIQGNLPDYLVDGWGKYLGGIVCSDDGSKMWGVTLIDDPFAWSSFDMYLPRKGKKALINTLIERIPYVYVNSKEDDISKQNKYNSNIKDFPNLRCMLDAREPRGDTKEYDLLFICYQFNQTLYWVKDGDFENGLYEITNPQDALDHYFVHVFKQQDQEFSRFDFSAWAEPLTLTQKLSEVELDAVEPEEEEEYENISIPVSDPELAAKLGHIPAQIQLGLNYSLGCNELNKNLEMGHDWFWQATKQGNLLAQYNWASYWCETPVYKEELLTEHELKQLSADGNLAATYMLGVYHENGDQGLAENLEIAVKYYQQAADQGFAPAINNLADKYETGRGIKKDLKQAFNLYLLAAEENVAAAQWSLALMYLNGDPVSVNLDQAKYYLEEALKNGWDNAEDILKAFDLV